jgi:peptide chain release factor 2
MLEQHKERVEEIRGDFSSPEWGNQIRSYVLHPYKMVKDHRTDFESKNPDEILAGELNGFIEAELKYFAKNI